MVLFRLGPRGLLKRDLAALAGRAHDLLVVGGGIHGVAAAWDAAQRGLDVALVERHDFGSGVSWNSLKTIHGGLRYLQKADLVRLRESVRERRPCCASLPRSSSRCRSWCRPTATGRRAARPWRSGFS